MVTVHIIGDAAVRRAVRSALEPAGIAVSEAADAASVAAAQPRLVIAAAASDAAAVRRVHPAVRVLVLPAAFTRSRLLAAVRLSLARDATDRGAATTASRPRSARRPRRRS